MSSFDTPSSEEILNQNEDETADTLIDRPIPVIVENSLRVDELPSTLGALRSVLVPAAGRAVQLVGRDARRKRLSINAFNKDIILSASEGDANAFQGYILLAGFGIPHHFDFQDELWARPCDFTVTGTDIIIIESTDACRISICNEQWAR